tara:strand:+ start:235 stop:441 length:207 start_codon:yes stop_codon:yes gene_type:complete
MFEIEKNIPIPKKKFGKWDELARKMEVGDSVLFEGQNDSTAFYIAAKNLGKKTTQRKINGKIRCWRIQ